MSAFPNIEKLESGPSWRDASDLPDYDAIERQVTEEIRRVFVDSIRVASAASLSLPSTSYVDVHCETREALTDAISDRIPYGKPFNALLRVLESSDCALVENLRKALASDYARANAADVAQVRGDA